MNVRTKVGGGRDRGDNVVLWKVHKVDTVVLM